MTRSCATTWATFKIYYVDVQTANMTPVNSLTFADGALEQYLTMTPKAASSEGTTTYTLQVYNYAAITASFDQTIVACAPTALTLTPSTKTLGREFDGDISATLAVNALCTGTPDFIVSLASLVTDSTLDQESLTFTPTDGLTKTFNIEPKAATSLG